MKKVLINAISIKMGGGVVVFARLLEEMHRLAPDVEWIVITDQVIHDKLIINNKTTTLNFPWIKKNPGYFLYWHEWVLPSLVREMGVDLFFSQTNHLPLRKLSCPSLLLIQNAGYFSKEYNALVYQRKKHWLAYLLWKLKSYWVYFSAKSAGAITVQTKALADAITAKLNISPENFFVVPHGPGLAQGETEVKQFSDKNCWRIGYITKLGIQKNFETLFAALQKWKERKLNFQLILTLDPQDVTYAFVAELIAKYGLTTYIENHGDIAYDEIRMLYQSLDIFVYPSLCESFGFTLVEAMYYGLPVLAADTKSNREILGDVGGLFDAKDSDSLAEIMFKLTTDSPFYCKLSTHSLARSQSFTWLKAAKDLLGAMNQLESLS